MFDDCLKFEVKKNSKIPAVKWSQKCNLKKVINTNKYNVGLPTGIINNMLVVDIDVKDDGTNEMQKYINKYGEINTLKQMSPSGGFHYFFNFTHAKTDIKYLIVICYWLNKICLIYIIIIKYGRYYIA